MFEDQKKTRERNVKIKETEISRLKSIKKELKSEEALAAENEEKRKVAKEEKMAGPLKLSNYNYEPPLHTLEPVLGQGTLLLQI